VPKFGVCAWRAYGVKPWKAESFRFSTDPELVGKVSDICGLYLASPPCLPRWTSPQGT